MSKWLLIFYIWNGTNATTTSPATVEFSDLASCDEAGAAVNQYLGGRLAELGGKSSVRWVCVPIKK
jgi:hypothetical protein